MRRLLENAKIGNVGGRRDKPGDATATHGGRLAILELRGRACDLCQGLFLVGLVGHCGGDGQTGDCTAQQRGLQR